MLGPENSYNFNKFDRHICPPTSDQRPTEFEYGRVYKLRELAGKVDIEIWPSLQVLCKENSIEAASLPQLVAEKIQSIAKTLREEVIYTATREPILFLAKCYHALQAAEDLPQALLELKDELSSYQNFRQTLLQSVDLVNIYGNNMERDLRTLISNVNEAVSPKQSIGFGTRRFRGNTDPWKSKIYVESDELESEWLLYSHKNQQEGKSVTFRSKRLVDYTQENPAENAPASIFFHATTSAALPGIAKHRALLSRSKLKEAGDYAHSGERADFDPRVFVSLLRTSGYHYTNTSWFNEFPIHIGLDKETRNLEERAPEHGRSLGHQVPIEHIKVIYAPFDRMEEVHSWAEANFLNLEVRPIEA